MLGSVIPSSRFLIKNLVRRIDWNTTQVVVEFGPGPGNITEELLRLATADAKIIAVELNSNLAALLRERITDPRLIVVEGSAADIDTIIKRHGIDAVDVVISGIPFSIMPDEVRRSVLDKSREVLRPGGSMLVYQFSRKVRSDLRRVFGTVSDAFEPLNFLPAHIFHCVKR